MTMQPPEIGDLLPFIVAAALYVLPGLALSVALTDRPGHFARALPLTIAVHFVSYEYLHLLGVRQSNVFSIAVIVAAVVYLVRITTKRWGQLSGQSLTDVLPSLVAGLALVYLWTLNAPSLGSLIPNHDAMNHSYMIRNIVETGSQQVADATRLFPLGAGQGGSFYPLGVHSLLAAAVRLTDLSISSQMNVIVFILSIAVFPHMMTLLCQRLFPMKSRLVSMVTPVVTLMSAFVFPFSPISWGGIAVIVAMAYTPIVAVALVDALRNPQRSTTVLAALLFVSLFVIHNTEAITAYLIAILVLLVQAEAVNRRSFVRVHLTMLAIAAVCIVPLLPGLVGGAQDRSTQFQEVLDPGVLVNYLLFNFTGVAQYGLLVLVTLALLFAHRRISRTFGVAYAALGAVCIIAGLYPSSFWVQTLLKPWYGQVLRLNYNIVYFLIPMLVGLAVTIWPSRHLPVLRTWPVRFPVVLIGLWALLSSVSTSNTMLNQWYDQLVPNTHHSIAAYEFMRERSIGVAKAMTDSDTTSNTTWMYAIAGVQPVNATAMTGDGRDRYASIKSALIENVGNLSSHPHVLKWIKDNEVQYFYYDDNVNPVSPTRHVTLESLRRESSLKQVFESGNAHVFEFQIQE